jgi:hypothetical protein
MTATTDSRAPRNAGTRELTERKASWAPPELLPEPVKEEGWAYRWIRTSTLGASDPMNVSAKQREGWEPVSIEEQPSMRLHESQDLRYRGNIEVGGLILCKMPAEFVEQRTEYYSGATQAQMDAVDSNYMRDNDPRMPLFTDKKTKVTFGSSKS